MRKYIFANDLDLSIESEDCEDMALSPSYIALIINIIEEYFLIIFANNWIKSSFWRFAKASNDGL